MSRNHACSRKPTSFERLIILLTLPVIYCSAPLVDRVGWLRLGHNETCASTVDGDFFMGFKDILVHVDSTVASTTRVWVSLALARRCSARVIGLHVTPNPDVPPYFKPSHIERIASFYKESAHKAAIMAESQFRKDVKDAGVETKL
jgi:hypothetical protein